MVKEGFSGSDICSVNAEQLQGNLGEVFQAGGIRGPKLGGFRGQKDRSSWKLGCSWWSGMK